ncbi:polyketide synthase-like protein [Xylariaceae sp. AK1471]|nr:polyketide synthase-like protein [Xylariaceae sp. AK1471]
MPSVSINSSGTTGSGQAGPGDLVCIVGLGCHLPGGVRSPSNLWDFIVSQKSAQGRVPLERFNMEGFYSPNEGHAGTMTAAGGYFINEDVRLLDNHFFGINNLEATYMDPLQRKLLEVTFECFEDAGYSLEQMSGSNTGVYVGDFTTDHQIMHFRDPDYLHRYSSTGSSKSILANRISHVFDLHGPSMGLNTACSSSVYSLHQAVLALQAGDCDAAIVAAANLILSPEQHLETMRAGVLSPTSTCHTFDISADGYGRGEGVGALFLKRFSSAVRDGDRIWGIIRATALNANGKTTGISQPSAVLQEAVIKKAYTAAGIKFDDTDYVECHGTGTAVGDVVEVNALKKCFGSRSGSPLRIGSVWLSPTSKTGGDQKWFQVKTNFGHSEATSGLTSIMKVLLSFKNGIIPPTYGVTRLNPKLALESSNIQVVTKKEEWPRLLRRASINSFGYGGANAHVILESVESYQGINPSPQPHCTKVHDTVFVLPVSARSKYSLQARLEQVSTLTKTADVAYLRALALTLSTRRSQLAEKAVIVALPTNTIGLQTKGRQLSIQKVDKVRVSTPHAFVFTGQGSQYPGMARELLLQDRTFSRTISELDSVLRALPVEHAPSWTLRQLILEPPCKSVISEATRSQSLCTAIQIGIVNLLREWGIHASATMGHSSGEIAAAYAAGILSQPDSILVAYLRGLAVSQLGNRGAMLAAGVAFVVAENMIRSNGLQGVVNVACNNGPESVTLSGPEESLAILASKLHEQKVFNRMLDTGGKAYHSPMMEEIGAYYEELMIKYLRRDQQAKTSRNFAAQMHFSAGQADEVLSPCIDEVDETKYWRYNLEKPVQFYPTFKNLVLKERFHIIEIGPHHGLKGPIHQTLGECAPDVRGLPYSPSLIKNQDSFVAMKNLAGALYIHGSTLNWPRVNNLEDGLIPSHHIETPPYAWDYSAGLLWHEPRASTELRHRKDIRHPLLGSRQLAGNGIDQTWRNIIDLTEVPWLKDHRVESQIVFPAAGYLCVAMEAMFQTNNQSPRSMSQRDDFDFHLRDVSINAALVLGESGIEADKNIELHTTLSARKLSLTTSSSNWHDFSISSWSGEHAVLHCVGSIRITNQTAPRKTTQRGMTCYNTSSPARWYDRLDELGLCFGPRFRSLVRVNTDSLKGLTDAVSIINLTDVPEQAASDSHVVHPITLDACLQTALIGASRGELGSLKARLPVFFANCWIKGNWEGSPKDQGQISTHSSGTGFSTMKAECNLRTCRDSTTLVDIEGVRFARYNGKIDTPSVQLGDGVQAPRNPCLRVRWKPDIHRIDSNVENDLQAYIAEGLAQLDMTTVGHAEAILRILLDLAGHKVPGMRVFELLAETDTRGSSRLMDILNIDSAFPLCRDWQTCIMGEDRTINTTDADIASDFDVLLIPKILPEQYWHEIDKKFLSPTESCRVVISHKTNEAQQYLRAANFDVLAASDTLLAVRKVNKSVLFQQRRCVIIYRRLSKLNNELILGLRGALEQSNVASNVEVLAISDIEGALLDKNTICISLLEAETEFLATLDGDNMDRLRQITDTVTDLLWVTTTNMLSKGQENPNLTLASGLSRTLMLEQPALRFAVIDIGPAVQPKPKIFHQIMQALIPNEDKDDKEFVCSRGLVYISRFCPDPVLNRAFRRRLSMESPLRSVRLDEAGVSRLAIDEMGRTDTIHFEQVLDGRQQVPSGFVDIVVKAVSINAKDVYALSGRAETREGTTACEFSGVIAAAASDVENLRPGDRVVVLWPNRFNTTERVPAWAVHKLLPDERYDVMATIPVVYSTALYALYDRANIKAGESILVHAGSGALGIAVIGIAKHVGAIVYATVGSQAKRDFLIAEFGLPASHLFSSRDTSFSEQIMELTQGRGVDIILNSLIGDLMHASWENCLAEFGRFIEVGKRELFDAGRLNMRGFLRGATFSAFDLEDLILSQSDHYRQLVARKVEQALELYRTRVIQLPPTRVFDVSDITQAYRYFSTKDRVGKVVISLERPESVIRISELKYSTVLDPQKVYLLVGCLGGLGRSLSRWMMARGAKNFVFLGRSGCAKPEAKQLVAVLRNAGASVDVVTGDVADRDAVDRAVVACKAAGRMIGGVVQAAMGLREAVFSSMANEAWHIGVRCKWAGTWNLHDALESHAESPEFFLMTSSNSGSVGVATEANYCAANGFLDAFARWRRSRGQPAISIGLGMISEVGYLHENPNIEAILIRRGVQAMPEDEFLQLIDFGLSQDLSFYHRMPQDEDTVTGHILSGLESVGFRKLLAQGFDVTNLPLQDPRSSRLAESLSTEQRNMAAAGKETGSFGVGGKEMDLILSLREETDPDKVYGMILQLVRGHFANLILIPADQIDDSSLLAQFGLDSMLAAEFRTWFWGTFKIDISFLDILGSKNSLRSLVGLVQAHVQSSD